MTMRHLTLTLLPALLLGVSSLSTAERMYKWVDANGNIQYGSRLPPEAALQQREELNSSGRVIKVYSAPPTAEERIEAKLQAELEAKRIEREKKRAIHDRALLATYSSKTDMLEAQEAKVSMVESLVHLTESRIKAMQKRMQKLTDDAAGFERGGKPVPEQLKKQMSDLRDQIKQNTAFSQTKQAEISQIKESFASDIARFEQLTTQPANNQANRKSALEIASSNPELKLTLEDRTLLTRFSSEADLLFARSEDLSQLDTTITATHETLESLQKKLAELTANATEYEATSRPLPDELATQLKNVIGEIELAEKKLQDSLEKKQLTEAQFAADLERFRYLTASNAN